jgi:hypothetical protein
MSEIIGIKLIGLKKLQATIDRIPPAVQDNLRVFMARFGLQLRNQVRTNILERFKIVTGQFPEAVKVEQIEEPQSVTSRVYIDTLPWAQIQEEGGKTGPHVIEPINGKALAFMVGGPLGLSAGGGGNGLVFAKRVNHPGSLIPERSYARLALVQMRAPFERGIRETVSEAIDQTFAVAAE